MFKKSERLSKVEFSHYFKTGKRYHSKYVTVIIDQHPTRKMAVIASKKVAKSAVRRNLLRRRVYAFLREELVSEGFVGVCIVILKPNFNSLSRKATYEELKKQLIK